MEKFDIILDLSNFKHDYHFCSLSKKCPYSELLWSVFSRIQAEYGEILRISPYSVRMRENVDQNNSGSGHFSRSSWYWTYIHPQEVYYKVVRKHKTFMVNFLLNADASNTIQYNCSRNFLCKVSLMTYFKNNCSASNSFPYKVFSLDRKKLYYCGNSVR